MHRWTLLLPLVLAGCAAPALDGDALVVRIETVLHVLGEGEPVRVETGPHCAPIRFEDGRLAVWTEAAGDPPEALVVRHYTVTGAGASSEGGDYVVAAPVPAEGLEVKAALDANRTVVAVERTPRGLGRDGGYLGEEMSSSSTIEYEFAGHRVIETTIYVNEGRVPLNVRRGPFLCD